MSTGVSRQEQPPPCPLRPPHSSLSHPERDFTPTTHLFPIFPTSGGSTSRDLEDAGAVNTLTSRTGYQEPPKYVGRELPGGHRGLHPFPRPRPALGPLSRLNSCICLPDCLASPWAGSTSSQKWIYRERMRRGWQGGGQAREAVFPGEQLPAPSQRTLAGKVTLQP